MIRRIAEIDRQKCNGCGACVEACHEGAISMINGKAVILRDAFCDGLGDCLPACPADAISFVERDTVPYDAAAVEAQKADRSGSSGCSMDSGANSCSAIQIPDHASDSEQDDKSNRLNYSEAHLFNWPVQLKLVPANAAYFQNARLLIAADCSAYAYSGFHRRFLADHVTLIGCPKLDGVNYVEKLAEILRSHDIREIILVRMSVPCCKGLERAVQDAMTLSGKSIPCQIHVLTPDGRVLKGS